MTEPLPIRGQERIDESLFIDVEGARLLAHVHRAAPGQGTDLGVVVCAAFADEQLASYRMVRRLSRELAEAGVSVLRFDPRGLGDSEGSLAEATPEMGLRDLERAIEELVGRTGVARVGLIGVRLGGSLAALAASRRPVAFLGLLAPILSAEQYFQRLIRRQVLSDAMYGAEVQAVDQRLAALRDGEILDVGGYPLSESVHKGYCAIELAAIVEKLAVPVWIGLASAPSGEAERLRRTASHTTPAPQLVACDDPRFWEFPNEGSVCPDPRFLVSRLVEWIAEQGTGSPGGR